MDPMDTYAIEARFARARTANARHAADLAKALWLEAGSPKRGPVYKNYRLWAATYAASVSGKAQSRPKPR